MFQLEYESLKKNLSEFMVRLLDKVATSQELMCLLWHAKMIFIQLTKYHATFKISFNFVKYIMELSK